MEEIINKMERVLKYWQKRLNVFYDGGWDNYDMVKKLDKEENKELYDYHEFKNLLSKLKSDINKDES